MAPLPSSTPIPRPGGGFPADRSGPVGLAQIQALNGMELEDRPTLSHMTPDGTQLCGKCRKRPATLPWGDAMTLNHGGGQWRCDICVLSEQLDHARERAGAIPELEQRLAATQAAEAQRLQAAPTEVQPPAPHKIRALPIDDTPRPSSPPDPARNPKLQREVALQAAASFMQDHCVPLLAHVGKSEIGSIGYKTDEAIGMYESQLRALGNSAWRRQVIRELQEIEETGSPTGD